MSIPTRVSRPDLRKLDTFHILASESTLSLLEEGALARAGQLRAELIAHDNCNMLQDKGCEIRKAWLIAEYGTIEQAEAQGAQLFDCSEDLLFLHYSLSKLMDFIMQCRYLRGNPTSRGYHELAESEAKFLAIKGELAHRTEQDRISTGQMAKLTPDALAHLDESTKSEATSLLSLNEDSSKAKPSVKAISTNSKK